ncbi:ion channel [Dongia sp. agr-C8]
MEFLLMLVLAAVFVVVCILVHYEIMRLTADYLLPRLSIVPKRAHVVFGICACFVAHTIEVWLFAGLYYVLALKTDSGFADESRRAFLDYLYFSTESYTSLGFSDARQLSNDLRLLAGIEAMIGLVLIAWTATFNYFMFEHYWVLHPRRRRHRAEDRLEFERKKSDKSKY